MSTERILMRDWKKGELQAFSVVAKLLIFVGIFMAGISWSNQEWIEVTIGVVVTVLGLILGFWLIMYQKRTGKSAKPFDRPDE